ncbi:MAG: DUF4345 domain-containing protein [Roseivirga sp.]|nr:DUF4345 domain-containing protein [Roseivirga sp.]
METLKIITLSLSGLLLLVVGAMRLSNPIKTYLKNSGIKLEKDVDLLNEMRGISGVMLLGGIIILLGTIIPELTTSSLMVASLLFLGFAIGRILGMVKDGKPNKLLIQGLVFELVFGSASTFCLITSLI